MPVRLNDEQIAQWRAVRKAVADARIELNKQMGSMQATLSQFQQECGAGEFDSPLDADQPGENGKKAGDWVAGAIRPMPMPMGRG